MRPVKLALFFLLLALGATARALPVIQHWTTPNGARVYFVPAPQIPVVDVRVVFDGGSARDEERPGRAVLTNALLAEGAGGLDADAIADRFDAVGAQFSNDALRDMAYIGLRTLTRPELMRQAVETAALVLTKPAFGEAALERERRRILVGLRAEAQDPETVADKAFFEALYGRHPYAHSPTGSEASVKALGVADLRAHYARYYVARNAVVAIVGDLDRAGAERLALSLVGSLPAGSEAPPLPPIDAPKAGERRSLPFPSSQTHILMGQPGMRRDDPDYFPLYVGNHILGGSGFTSRIVDEVREKRGLAYSAYSYFTPMRLEGPFTLGLQTANANGEQALSILRETLARFVEEGPTERELEASKKNITGGFALNVDSNSDIVQFLSMIGFYRLPLDYLNRFNERVTGVSVDQVREAFRRRVDPSRMAVVTVGGQ